MKKEIIQLAKEKGFENYPIAFGEEDKNGDSELISVHNNDRMAYIWLCELQKWLRDERSLAVIVSPYAYPELYFEVNIVSWGGVLLVHKYNMCRFCTYEEALEKGCYEALKLISE